VTGADEKEPSVAASALQADIAVTRQRVASEVDAITDKLSIEHVKRELAATAAEVAMKALRVVKAKPLPFVVVGVGLMLAIWKLRAGRS
jgi:hypothetical protein